MIERAAASLALLLALTGVALSVAAGRSDASRQSLPVLGFQSEDSPAKLIDRNARAISLTGVDGVNLTGPGTVSAIDPAALGQLARAHHHRLPAVLLLGNWSAQINDFSEPLAYQTLGSQTATDAAAEVLAGEIMAGGFDGVSVDLESLAPRDRAGLTRFVSDLRAQLPAVDSVTVCVSAFTSTSDYAANGYDLSGLATRVDQIVLMTYDDHGPWENQPGPIGPLAWQRASVRALERLVAPNRIWLGAADYAYAWRPHSNDNLTVAQARALAARWHARPRWARAAAEWTAKLRDGSTLWWSDARSVGRREQLARSLGLHGLAVWSLGTGDRIPPT